jgi:catechol 2,3-dioxygenase-like lactoylglutathione lyase family enzyme
MLSIIINTDIVSVLSNIFLMEVFMLSEFSYPIICTKKFKQTVNFYEDYFNYAPELEMPCFVVLKRQDWDNCYLAVIDANHHAIPEPYRRPVSGMLLNYPVKDVEKAYDRFYLEGLNVVSEPITSLCSKKHFFIEDPNGILIDIGENVKPLYDRTDLKQIEEKSFEEFCTA